MRILAIDTATEACSTAIWDNGKCFSYFEKCPGKHAQRVLLMVKEILFQRKMALTDFDALAFSRGPGSFTGVRIGIGIAQGLALGANLPMISISTLATLAQGVFRQKRSIRILTAIDARMEEIYWAEYIRDEQNFWHGEDTETIYKLEMLKLRLKMLSGEWTIAGTGWKRWIEKLLDHNLTLIDANICLPSAEDMLPIACHLLEKGKTVLVEQAEPIYLRKKVAWKKLNKQ